MEIEALHIAAGINPIYTCLDLNSDGILIYGSHNQIYLYDYNKNQVIQTLSGHKYRINACKIISNFSAHTIISACSEGLN